MENDFPCHLSSRKLKNYRHDKDNIYYRDRPDYH